MITMNGLALLATRLGLGERSSESLSRSVGSKASSIAHFDGQHANADIFA